MCTRKYTLHRVHKNVAQVLATNVVQKQRQQILATIRQTLPNRAASDSDSGLAAETTRQANSQLYIFMKYLKIFQRNYEYPIRYPLKF